MDTDWVLMDFEPPKRAGAAVSPPAPVRVQPAPGVCPKCWRHIGRGLHIHAKNCKGEAD